MSAADLTKNDLVPAEDINSFVKVMSFFNLSRNCLYNISDLSKWDFDIALSKKGEKIFNKLKKNKNSKELPDGILKYAIFLDMYHEDLYVDLKSVNIYQLEKFFNDKIISKEILLPWVYERLLYDKYFETFSVGSESLVFDDSIKLLDSTPQGVFQTNNYVFGPLGVLTSLVKRDINPKISLKLWHCSDPACSAFHTVELHNDINTAFDYLLSIISDMNSLIEHKEFHEFFIDYSYEFKEFVDDQEISNIYIS